jgi:hypothetical protein
MDRNDPMIALLLTMFDTRLPDSSEAARRRHPRRFRLTGFFGRRPAKRLAATPAAC